MFDAIAYINTPRWQQSRLGLDRTRLLMEKLGRPQDQLKFVHVAGTNGKGSTCSYLSTVLQEAGYKTGLFTSPYIECFEERIRVNGKNISSEDLTSVTLTVKEAAEQVEAETGDHPTEFELMTAVALVHFAQQGCQIVVLEVGLGGRLDSTNIIEKPEVSVICRLGLDHTAILGDTLGAIAAEKGGIIKVGCPVVSYPQEPEAAAVIESIAADKGCPMAAADLSALDMVGLASENGSLKGLFRTFTYKGKSYRTQLLATYQPSNAALALEALFALQRNGWDIPAQAISAGIQKTVWPGRFEMLPTTPCSIVDGGHNPQGAQALADTLDNILPALRQSGVTGPVVFLIGLLADKDYPAMLRIVAPFAQAIVATQPHNPRALSATDLANALKTVTDAPVFAQANAPAAVSKAKDLAGTNGLVVAFGSLYQVGEIKHLLLKG